MTELTENERDAIADARNFLESYGFVILREKSYRQAQTRHAVAVSEREFEIRERQSCERWAQGIARENRYLRDRCTFLYVTAQAAGCSAHELAGRPATDVLDQLDELEALDEQAVTHA